jgi:hypothetical protein
MKLCATVLLLTISPAILATDFTCTNGTAERSIKVAYEKDNSSVPCKVVYEKKDTGTVEYPWNANNEVGYCEEKAKYLAARLAGFGWQCVEQASTDD